MPESWHLARVQGTRDQGYLRLDDDEQVRMELRWEKPAKRPEKFQKMADRMLARMEKLSQRRKAGYTVKRGVRVAAPEGKEFECFETVGQGISYGCLMRCGTCGRTLLCRVLGSAREDLKSIAGRIFESLTDHPGDDKLDHWDVYGLAFSLPPDFTLLQTKMRTGALELLFFRKRTEIDIRRLSLAGVLLKDCTLKNFFTNYIYKDIKDFKYEAEEIPVKGHAGVGLTGPKSLRGRLISRTLGKRFVYAFAWLCDDKIFIFRMTTPQAEDPQFFDLADRVQCHSE
ncbi:MAG TPA: hypothetical protein VM141_06290 [Planctomycetota bacterium]|nr:hypothetical protein [Planctomycetota bacterium]